MTTTTQRTLPAGYVETMGEDFAGYIDGTATNAIDTNSWYVDPSTYMGNAANNYYTAGTDALTTEAQTLAQGPNGLGSYQAYLENAEGFATKGKNFFNNNGTAYQTNMTNANNAYDNAGTMTAAQAAAAAAGQNAGASQYALQNAALGNANNAFGNAGTQFNNATGQYDLAAAAAAAGQNAGAANFAQADQYSGANAYQQFMSPYQQQVIDASMAAFNQQAQEQQAMLGASAGNAFGGSRYGVAEGQMLADQTIGGAQLQGNLLAQGFNQANQNAQAAYAQQMGLGQANMGQAAANQNAYQQAAQGYGQAGQNQMGLGQGFQNQATGQMQAGNAQQQMANNNASLYGQAAQAYGLQGANQMNMANTTQQQVQNQMGIYAGLGQQQMDMGQYGLNNLNNQMNTLTTMGQQNTAAAQAKLNAEQAAKQAGATAEQQNLGFYGQMLGVGYGSPSSTSFITTPNKSTLDTLLGAGVGLGGIIGAFNKGKD